eukprot:scaffold3670_cov124-Cylindrotheca_fusiformis.AAC.6
MKWGHRLLRSSPLILLLLRFQTSLKLYGSKLLPGRHERHHQQLGASMDLPEVYRSIANKAWAGADSWPESSDFLKCLDQNREGDFVVPTFPEGEGPIGVFALASRNLHPGSSNIVKECLGMFDSFCADLRTGLFPDGGGFLEDDFVVVQSLAPHITVSIFQEHPRLLHQQEPTDVFHFIEDDKIRELAKSLANRASKFEPIDLLLDSILLTSDGAMIAGFVDLSVDGSFNELKGILADDAMAILQGKVTSRPKRLIHMTCGRIASKTLQDSEQQLAMKKLVQRYNQELLPRKVGQLNDRIFRLDELSLLRNDVWLCESCTQFGAGILKPASEQ